MKHQEIKSPVGVKNKDLWLAYQEVKSELQEAETQLASTTATAQAKKVGAAIEEAKKIDADDLVASLDQIGNGIREAKAVYDDLEVAIDSKKQELKEVHGLEVEVNSFVAVVATKDKLVAERTEAAKTILEDAKAEADKIKAEAQEAADKVKADSEAEQKKFEKELEEHKRETEKEQQRAKNDWEYEFQRLSKAKMDAFNDEIGAKRKDMAEREAKLSEREQEADKRDKELEDIKTHLDTIEENTLSRIAAAVEEANAKAKKAAAFEKTMIEKSYDAKIQVLTSTNEGLRERILDLTSRLDRAEAQVQNANDRVTTIATGALKAGADANTVSKVAEIAAGSSSKK